MNALEAGKALLTEAVAGETGLAVGSHMTVVLATGKSADVVVGGVVADNPGLSGFTLPLGVQQVLGGSRRDDFLYVTAKQNADLGEVRSVLDAQLAAYPDIKLQDQAQFKQEFRKQINQLLTFIYVLLALAVVIAILGIVNTLWLSVIERTREVGLMRAVGTTRGQLGCMVVLESVVISVFGALLGLGTGTLLGVLAQRLLVGQGITQLALPLLLIGTVALAAPVVGTLAAAMPAWRSTRLDVLQAIATH